MVVSWALPAGQRYDFCVAVISGNDFHRRAKNGKKAGILSQNAWEPVICQKLDDLWQDLLAHATCAACIVFFGTGQSYRLGWPNATEEDLDRFDTFMKESCNHCVRRGAIAHWYAVDHLDLMADGWHPTKDTCCELAGNLMGIVNNLNVAPPHLKARRL